MDTTLARPPIGQLLDGRYRVESHLAHGGMATVYLGTDTRLDRTVALKIMHAELANDEDFVRRFVAEARSVARLSHPNVVTVYDQGADGRTLFLAMEYVPGRTLRDLLHERGRLAPREALDIMDGVLAGLAAAHTAGIAHRDVKPENVLLGNGQTVKVADFGLARFVAGTSHTKSGMIIGTAAYLAPEQVLGRQADARTDVYAGGVMLFELLTGSQPHRGESPLAVAYRHVNDVVPPPSSLVPDLPPALDALVALATSRDPELRPGDAGQLLHAIGEVRSGLPLSGRPGPALGGLPGPALSGPALPAPPPERAAWPRPANLSSAQTAPPGHVPAISWSDPPPAIPAPAVSDELIPGMSRPPATGPFGSRDGGSDAFATTRRLGQEPSQPGVNKTLVVRGGGDDAFGPPPRRGYRREPWYQRLLFSRRLGYLALTMAVVLVVSLLGWWVLEGRYTTVPMVGGLSVATAQADLKDAGLNVTTGTSQLDNQVAKGMVIRTLPGNGARITRGATVTLIVSAGPHMIAMPQVTGLTLDAAEAAIHHAGLTPGQTRHEASDTIPAGIVISTSPAAGANWPQPKPVDLVVSAGPPLPNFVGQQKAVAEEWAQAHGVSLNEQAAKRSDQPPGTIVRQSVPPGSPFSANEVITIVYSNGPPQVAIPNVDGMRADRAARLLAKLGFQVSVQTVGPFQTVFDYDPKGQAPMGSVITLRVGLPSFGG